MTINQENINSFAQLRNIFENQVTYDNKQFNIDSVFLPNPVFTSSPKHCLIAMEPSLGRCTPHQVRENVNQGFLNFLNSEEDFILHFCSYKFLCQSSFEYYITDISKGAMKTEIAANNRNERYSNWKNILSKELEFFHNPILIAVGTRSRDFLKVNKFRISFYVLHYSQNNNVRFLQYYQTHSHKSLSVNIHIEIKEFASELMDKSYYSSSMKETILNKLFKKELSDWKKGMFLNYYDRFSTTGTQTSQAT